MANKSEMVAQYTALAQLLEAGHMDLLRKQIYTVLAEASGSKSIEEEIAKILKPLPKRK